MLNVARQELSTTGEVLVQDGFTSEGTLFVEDGSGTKSGLKLGVSLVECVDPTTPTGAVNVRFADRTYAKIRDLKIFSTAIASAQAALSEATSTSISNLETAVQLLEDDINSLGQNFQENFVNARDQLQTLSLEQRNLSDKSNLTEVQIQTLENRVSFLENPSKNPEVIEELVAIPNSFYYTGTISVSDSTVIGTDTRFSSELEVGSNFIASTADGEDVEFTVLTFDPTTPNTRITVSPGNRTLPSGTRFRKSDVLELKKKVNQIISTLRKLKFIV